MAKTIKGITVEIGGNTTKLQKAMEAANSSIKKTQSELKEVDKALKLDPSNLTMLTQKQELLTKSIEDTGNKLKALEEVQEQVEQQFKSGKIGEEAYRDFQREVETTRASLKNLEAQQSSVNSKIDEIKNPAKEVDNAKSKYEQAKEAVSKVVKVLIEVGEAAGKAATAVGKVAVETAKIEAKAVGIAADEFKKYAQTIAATATAIAGFSVKTGITFEEQMSTVAAISGAAGDEFDQLKAKAKEMGETTEFSATQSAEAMEYMAMAGWDTTDILDGLAGVMDLASASGEDLATVSDIVTDAMTAFGMTAEESTRFSDVLAKTASSANTNVAMMGETFKNVAPLAGAMGYSIEDMSVAIGLMANSGIKGQKSGTALKNIITNLADPTDEVAAAMTELGVSLTNAAGETRPFEEVVDQLRSAFDGLTESEKAQYASTIAGKQGMAGLLAVVNSSEADYRALSEEINNASGAAAKMAEVKLDNLSGDIKLLKSSLEGTALSIYESLAPGLRELVGDTNNVVTALKEHGLAGALEEAGMLVYNLSDRLTKSLPKALPKFISGFNSFVLVGVQGLVDMLPTITEELLPELLIGFNDLVQGLVAEILAAAPYILQGAATLFTGLLDGLNQVAEQLVNMLPDIVDLVGDTLENNGPTILKSGLQLLVTLLTGLSDNTDKIVATVVSLIPVFVDTITEHLPEILDAGLTIIEQLTLGILDNLDVIIKAAADLISAFLAEAALHLDDILGFGLDIIVAIGKGIAETFSPISDALSDWLVDVVDWFKQKWRDFKDLGKQIIDGIAEGIVEGFNTVKGALTDDFVDNWLVGIKDILGIHSPSTLFRDQIGKNMALGIGVGFEQEMSNVTDAMNAAIPRSFDTNVAVNASAGSFEGAAPRAGEVSGTTPGGTITFILADSAGATIATAVANPLDIINGQMINLSERKIAGV
ncbi:MAG: phage tail tape measure protein [Ruminococcus sp.]|nr:phage tail tape measure protein [Ruminococcus sp.]